MAQHFWIIGLPAHEKLLAGRGIVSLIAHQRSDGLMEWECLLTEADVAWMNQYLGEIVWGPIEKDVEREA